MPKQVIIEQNTLQVMSISAFKALQGIDEIQIIKNPKTGKLFASDSKGQKYKVQGDLDLKAKVAFLHDTEDSIDDGCFINPSETNVLATL